MFTKSLSLPKSRFDGVYMIDTIFQKKYADTLIPQLQEMGTPIADAVEVETGIVGEYKFFQFSASRTANKETDKFGDTPINHQQYSRRRMSLESYEDGDLLVDTDKIRAAIDPAGDIQTEMRYAFGRAKEAAVIDAMDADVYTGKDGGTTTSLPATQTIAVTVGGSGGAACGMNLTKFRRAKRLLDAAKVPIEEERYACMSAYQIEEMLSITEVTSSDFNSVKALADGKINSFLGFKIIQSELLETDTSGYRKCLFFTKKAIKLGIGKDFTAMIYNRGDKKMNVQLFSKMFIGALRMHDLRVVLALCLES